MSQHDKVENKQPAGLLEPLPIPDRPWESISLDFISALPKSEMFGSIMVVVDRFSKYGTFIPCTKDCTAEEVAKAFFKNVVKYWGLPRHIVSDRDPPLQGQVVDGVVQTPRHEAEFLHKLSPTNRRPNLAGECVVGVVTTALREC